MADGAKSFFILIYILEYNLFNCLDRSFLLNGLRLKIFVLNEITAAWVCVKVFIECFERVDCSLLLNHCFGDMRMVIDELGTRRFLNQILFLCRCEFFCRDNQ